MTTTLYLPNDKMRLLTYRQWKRMGGNGMGGRAAGNAAEHLGCRVSDLEDMAIGQITDAWIPAGRAMARHAAENFPKRELTEVERVLP